MKKYNPQCILIYSDIYELFTQLSDEQRGKFLMALAEYAFFSKTDTNLDTLTNMVYLVAKRAVDVNREKFQRVSEMRSQFGKKGGAPVGNKNAQKKQPQNNPKTTPKQPQNNLKQPKQAKQAKQANVCTAETPTTSATAENQKQPKQAKQPISNTNTNTNTNISNEIEETNSLFVRSFKKNERASELFDKNSFQVFWQTACCTLQQPLGTFTARRVARLSEICSSYGNAQVARALETAAQNKELNGNNKKKFVASFDWCLKNFESLWLDYCTKSAQNNFPKKDEKPLYVSEPPQTVKIDREKCIPMPPEITAKISRLYHRD